MLYEPSPLRSINNGKIHVRTVTAFLITLALSLLLVCVMILNRISVEKLTMEQVILEKSVKVNNVITKLLYKTQSITSMILDGGAVSGRFEQMASVIVDDPAILNILVAPDGVVTEVYPLEGNEAVIDLDFFSEGAGNKEAILARESGSLVLGGPFTSVQGEQVLVGRLPVFVDGKDGYKTFWGLVSVTLKYPQALDGAGLNELRIQGFAYEIWRINPDDNDRQIIASSGHSYGNNVNYVEKKLSIENAEWYFRILPVRAWYEFPETWMSLLISIFVSALTAVIVQNNHELRLLKSKLETQSNTDPLTGIYNRRFFEINAAKQLSRNLRTKNDSFIILFDLDKFKTVNDRYGHLVGDAVLNEISLRVTKALRPYDLFARYGGEEFIILAADLDAESVMQLTERLRLNIGEAPIAIDDLRIPVTASFGVAYAAPVNKLEASIALADQALYKAKSEGRNKIVISDGEKLKKVGR